MSDTVLSAQGLMMKFGGITATNNVTLDLKKGARHALIGPNGAGKSTIMNLSHALWAVLGRRKKKFVVIISNTVNQAQGHFSNILWELKNNRLLASDLGPFDVDHNNRSLVLTAFEAKIMAVSREQSIRGLLFGSCSVVSEIPYNSVSEQKYI